MSKEKSVSILGCGWLGLPLARSLMATGHRVKGSTRSKERIAELEASGVEAFQVLADPDAPLLPEAFFQGEILLIDIPPGRKDPGGPERYPEKIRSILDQARKGSVERVLFTSSTSVHPENGRTVSEEDPPSEKGNGPFLHRAEELVKESFPRTSSIVRFGGLIGPGRHPVRYLSGKKSSRNGEAPVNMIHQKDAVAILQRILQEEHWGSVFDACAPEHPTRRDFYQRAAERAGLPGPTFDEEAPLSYKIVEPKRLEENLGYRFHYPDPLEMPVE